MSVKAVKKSAKTDKPLYLAVVRGIGSPKRTKSKSTSKLGANNVHGMTKENKGAKMKLECLKQDFKSVQEQEQQ